MKSYQPAEVVNWKQDCKMQVIALGPEYHAKPRAIHVFVRYVCPRPKAHKKSLHMVTKPDLSDNLNKGLFDAMTGVLWEDDSQVVSIESHKGYCGVGELPHIDLQVTGL